MRNQLLYDTQMKTAVTTSLWARDFIEVIVTEEEAGINYQLGNLERIIYLFFCRILAKFPSINNFQSFSPHQNHEACSCARVLISSSKHFVLFQSLDVQCPFLSVLENWFDISVFVCFFGRFERALEIFLLLGGGREMFASCIGRFISFCMNSTFHYYLGIIEIAKR